jgi:DMSO reductase iron-sulfur subunit
VSTGARQKGFLLDTDLCTGCAACAVACAIENELPWGTSWRWIETFNPRHLPGIPSYHLSLACNHCADAPCMHHCPALAYGREPLTGAVLLDPERCIGCRYCTWACPYDAPRFDPGAGVVAKCTFCHHRQVEGLSPACVQQCPTGALSWGDLADLGGTPDVPGFPRTDARPSMRFTRNGRAGSPMGGSAAADRPPEGSSAAAAHSSKTSLASEGPLVLFTLLAALLAGMLATARGRSVLGLGAFLTLAVAAAGASTLHLGRKARAWRAVLNVRRSWLSREVALFSAFVLTSAWVLSSLPSPPWIGTGVGVLGFGLLFAVDRVYAVTRTPRLAVHSAGALSTGLLVAGLTAGLPVAWGGILAAKVVSFAGRTLHRARRGRAVRPGWAVLRVTASIVGALLLLVTRGGPGGPAVTSIALVLLGVGEVVDRCAFYLELEVPTPRQEMAGALAAARRREV